MEQRFLSFDVEGMNHVDQLVTSLLDSALAYLNEKAEGHTDLYHKMKPNTVEQLSYESMLTVAPSVNFPKERIELISGHVFPDILLHDTRYGVEIKSTQKDAWTSTGSSIIESTRDKDTERIYMLFAKLGGIPEFRCKPYQQCLSNIAVTHSPRYLIDMNLPEEENIFSLMNTDYDVFRQMDEASKITQVRQYYMDKAKAKGKHEMPWWMGSTTNINISFYADLDPEEKRELESKAFILFPSLFNISKDRQDKYKTFALWLCANYSVLCTNMRDLFTAGGSIKYINGKKLDVPYPHIVGDLLNLLPRIKNILANPDEQMSKSIDEFWDFDYDKNNLYSEWLNMIEKKFSSQEELEWIPIRQLIESDSLAQISIAKNQLNGN